MFSFLYLKTQGDIYVSFFVPDHREGGIYVSFFVPHT